MIPSALEPSVLGPALARECKVSHPVAVPHRQGHVTKHAVKPKPDAPDPYVQDQRLTTALGRWAERVTRMMLIRTIGGERN